MIPGRLWQWIVASSKNSPVFFLSFSVLTVGVFGAAAVGLQSLTNPEDGSAESLRRERELLKTGRKDGLVRLGLRTFSSKVFLPGKLLREAYDAAQVSNRSS